MLFENVVASACADYRWPQRISHGDDALRGTMQKITQNKQQCSMKITSQPVQKMLERGDALGIKRKSKMEGWRSHPRIGANPAFLRYPVHRRNHLLSSDL